MKFNLALSLPYMGWQLFRARRKVDAIHIRFSSNLSLVGVLLAPLFSKPRIAKFTTNWLGYPGEPLLYRFQRWLLRSRWWGRAVTVYGEWPDQPRHVIPFFTAMMTKEEVNRSVDIAAKKKIELPLRLLFCGRLFYSKQVDDILRAVQRTANDGLKIEFTVVGDGPEANSLRQLAVDLGIDDRVNFTGALPYKETIKWYEWAHCLVLPSAREGWPKVVAEAMCHGIVCIATACGQVPAMLTERGILLKDGTPEEIAASLWSVADNPEAYESIRRAASVWSRAFTLERLHDALAEVLKREWGVPAQYEAWD